MRMKMNACCRLCFNVVTNDNAEFVKDIEKDVLGVLLIKLDLEDSDDLAFCSVCHRRLLAAFEFKSMCMRTDSAIIPYVDWQNPLRLDLRDIYLKEKDDKQISILSEDEKICRLCMTLTGKAYVPLQEKYMDGLHKLLPEINTSIVKEPVVCMSCYDSWLTHNNFLMNCLHTQGIIENSSHQELFGNMDKSSHDCLIKAEEGDIKYEEKFSSDSCIEQDQMKREIDENEYMCLEDEDIKKEVENNQTSDRSGTPEIYPVALVISSRQTEQITTSSGIKETGVYRKNNDAAPKEPFEGNMHKCDMCHYKTDSKRRFNGHQMIHKHPSPDQMFKCDTCDYGTRFKDKLKRHQMIHKDPSEVQMHKCNVCEYETKFKSYLQKHHLIHKDPSEVVKHKCDICNYETKFKYHLKSHQLVHKDGSQVSMHNCESCDYKTKHRIALQRHLLLHKDRSEVQMFKCDVCDYETKFKDKLKCHQLVHKDASQVKMYKCETCGYETKYKSALNKHQLMHGDLSQIQVYKCDECEYKTVIKERLKRHVVIHKDPSKIEMHSCHICDFETKYKTYLKKHHLLIHKYPSRIQM